MYITSRKSCTGSWVRRSLLRSLPLQLLIMLHGRNGRHRAEQNLRCHLDPSRGRGHARRAVIGARGVDGGGARAVAGRVGALGGAAIVVQIRHRGWRTVRHCRRDASGRQAGRGGL